jgi:uroporphyrinogen decarboxylase
MDFWFFKIHTKNLLTNSREGKMTTSLERVGAVIEGKLPDRVPVMPFMLGATRRAYGVTYAEWAQDGELAAKCQLQAQELIGYDGRS